MFRLGLIGWLLAKFVMEGKERTLASGLGKDLGSLSGGMLV